MGTTINVKNLIGKLTIITTGENLEADLEAKITTSVLKALKSAQVEQQTQQPTTQEEDMDKFLAKLEEGLGIILLKGGKLTLDESEINPSKTPAGLLYPNSSSYTS